MKIVSEVLQKVEQSGSQLVAVTKYFSRPETQKILSLLLPSKSLLSIGENRTSALRDKQLPPKYVHFIGNIQSREIPTIIQHCSGIHSLASLSHAKKIAQEQERQRKQLDLFIQINISEAPQKHGILPDELPEFIQSLQPLNLNIQGISALGAAEFTIKEKHAEFQKLIQLRDTYLPHGKISAGTSRDYEFALEAGIEIVRIGHALFTEDDTPSG